MPTISTQQPWMVSLHGGHSGEFCDHAEDRLEQLVQQAIALGMPVYGLTEHAPRVEPQHVYDEEKALGWDTAHLEALFGRYAAEAKRLQVAYGDRIALLVGVEAEVIPEGRYVEVMCGLREQYALDYFVGSVHWVDGIIIDYTRDRFDRAVEAQGGLERLALRYYDIAAEMVASLRPEVVGHLDLLRRYGGNDPALQTTAVQERAKAVLALMKEHGMTSVATYYGDTEAEDRQDIVTKFQEPSSDLRFFVGNPRTGGYGLTLTAATTVVYYSNSFDLEVRLQSEDRAHRIGQTSNVTYVDLIATDTVDEHIVKALRNKINIASAVLGEEFKDWLI